MNAESDRCFMASALELAREAAAAGEVPVGAVAVRDGRITAGTRNRVEAAGSVTAHAEIELLHALEEIAGDWRLSDFTVYVTKEPCPMCAGALINARVRRIVFGAPDPGWGGCGGAFNAAALPGALWKPEITGGVLAEECGAVLREFFRAARRGKAAKGGAAARDAEQSGD